MGEFDQLLSKKPFLLQIISKDLIELSEEFFHFSTRHKIGHPYGRVAKLNKISDWIYFYKQRRKLVKIFLEQLRTFGESPAKLADFIEFTLFIHRERQKISDDEIHKFFEEITDQERKELQELSENVQESVHEFAKEYETFSTTEGSEIDSKLLNNSLSMPEIIFLLYVWLPCWFLYGTLPAFLLRKARLGDPKSIDRLLRLNKMALHDPKLSEKFHQIEHDHPYQFKDIAKALLKGPKVHLKRRQVKITLAGFLSKIALHYEIWLGYPVLTVPEIEELFHAYARDHGNKDGDPDLYGYTPESFFKAIQRARDFWTLLPKPDKK